MYYIYMIGARVVDGVSKIREEELTPLVEEFYARVRADPALGPIFNDAIDDWPEHLGKLTAFWSSVMLTSGRYKGQPVPAHLKHKARITSEGAAHRREPATGDVLPTGGTECCIGRQRGT